MFNVEQSSDSSEGVSACEDPPPPCSLCWAGPSSGDALILGGACCFFCPLLFYTCDPSHRRINKRALCDILIL
ncbi:hypothetical protein JTE90_006551 [Oedothorax gibbosus]|uniref:Uncharacterized protein n=1 Tax=Oedothorax gibbosus TaxID=931172 RepID=A0AAV6VKF9_9ARAC|nr:hypothetical protein JTE90_006551 [Oedothorax gibbosus]